MNAESESLDVLSTFGVGSGPRRSLVSASQAQYAALTASVVLTAPVLPSDQKNVPGAGDKTGSGQNRSKVIPNAGDAVAVAVSHASSKE